MYYLGLEAFLAVSETQNISQAAKLLHVTQSAVSHRIKGLEEQLGIVLLDRQKGVRHCKLTLAGENLYPVAEKWRQLWYETKQLQSTISALSLKIGCVDSVNTLILPELYQALLNNNPPVFLRIYTMPSLALFEKVDQKEMDVAFVLQKQHYKNLEVAEFQKESMMVVRNRPKGRKPPGKVKISDLDPSKELYIKWSPSYHIWHEQLWEDIHHPTIELDSVFLIEALLSHSDRWAIVPQSVAGRITANQNAVAQEIQPKAPDRCTYMVTHRYPRIGAVKGIEIVAALSEKLGFLM